MPVCFNDLVRLSKNLRKGEFKKVSFAGIRKTATFPITNSFAIQGRFNAISTNERSYYDTVIVFHFLNFGPKQTKELPIEINPVHDAVLYMERPSLSDINHLVTVTCTCDDYFWTWWYNNRHKARAHAWGDLPHPSEVTDQDVRSSDHKPYGSKPGTIVYYKVKDPRTGKKIELRRQAPPGWDPRRNPVNTPGVCKHIYNLGMYLVRKKVIKK